MTATWDQDGTVNLRAAVRLDALLRFSRSLPVCGTVRAVDARPVDRCGRKRSTATLPGAHRGRRPGNAGKKFPPTPPTPTEVLAIMEQCTSSPADIRFRALIAVLWRTGLRISEALDLTVADVREERDGLWCVHVRCGKGGKARVSGIDQFALDELRAWLTVRERYRFPVDAPIFCVVEGPTKGGRMGKPYINQKLKRLAVQAGVRKRVAAHQLRHAHAVDLAHEGVPIHLVSRQLGHANLAITTTYLAGISPVEVLSAISHRELPSVAGLKANQAPRATTGGDA